LLTKNLVNSTNTTNFEEIQADAGHVFDESILTREKGVRFREDRRFCGVWWAGSFFGKTQELNEKIPF
jgi:hypothetical protein